MYLYLTVSYIHWRTSVYGFLGIIINTVRYNTILNTWLENWQHCSHVSDTSWDVHSYLMFSANFKSKGWTRLTWQQVVYVCAVVMCYENGKTKSRAALRHKILRQTQQKHNRNLQKIKTGVWRATLSRVQVFRWYKAFLDGQKSVERRTSFWKTLYIKNGWKCDQSEGSCGVWSSFYRMISSELNLSHRTIHNILTEELGMQKICAKLIPKNLTNKQKENRRNVCLTFLKASKMMNFFSNMS